MTRKFHHARLTAQGDWVGIEEDEKKAQPHPSRSHARATRNLPRPAATRVRLWGTGTPRREFLFSDDLADACVFLMNLPDQEFDALVRHSPDQGGSAALPPFINIGVGEDLTIRELAELVARVVGYEGEIIFDASKPDGTPRKVLDVSRMRALGWGARQEPPPTLKPVYFEYLS